MVRSLATGPEADGDPKLPATLACDLDARNVRAHLGGGGAQGVCRTYSDLGRLTGGGECLTVMQSCFG